MLFLMPTDPNYKAGVIFPGQQTSENQPASERNFMALMPKADSHSKGSLSAEQFAMSRVNL